MQTVSYIENSAAEAPRKEVATSDAASSAGTAATDPAICAAKGAMNRTRNGRYTGSLLG